MLEYCSPVWSPCFASITNKKYVPGSVELGVCPMQLFHFWSRDVHPVQNLLLCTKFHRNRMIFPWDMAIYRFSKWRPSAILELFYHHTRPLTNFLLLAAAACQISCQSDRQIWRYSYLNFSHIGLKCLFRPPKSASVKLSTVKIRWRVWPVGELTESVTDALTQTVQCWSLLILTLYAWAH